MLINHVFLKAVSISPLLQVVLGYNFLSSEGARGGSPSVPVLGNFSKKVLNHPFFCYLIIISQPTFPVSHFSFKFLLFPTLS